MVASGNISSDERYFLVNDFDALDSIVNKLERNIEKLVLEGKVIRSDNLSPLQSTNYNI